MNELFEKGLKKRRATLGTDYVDNTMAHADKLNRPFQEAMTAWCLPLHGSSLYQLQLFFPAINHSF